MSARNKPPFRADHVGSLLRPAALAAARADHKTGKVSSAALQAAEDEAVAEAARRQAEIGLQVVTDGEMRRVDWMSDFKYRIGGVKLLDRVGKVPFETPDGKVVDFEFVQYRVAEKVRLERCIFGEHFSFLKSVADALPGKPTPKLTIPSPSMMHYPAGRGIDRAVYPDMDEFFADIAKVYADEIAALDKLGCSYLQMDDTSLAFLNDPNRRAMLGAEADAMHLKYISVFNAAIAGKPAGMTVCTHLCRGNFRSGWMASGSYDHVADALFNTLDVDGFFLEFDDERSGGFEPLRFVPKGKTIVLGLVTTKSPVLESKDVLKRRIETAAKFVPLDQLCLSPQCGFASTEEGNELSIDNQYAKLRLVAETAREVWG